MPVEQGGDSFRERLQALHEELRFASIHVFLEERDALVALRVVDGMFLDVLDAVGEELFRAFIKALFQRGNFLLQSRDACWKGVFFDGEQVRGLRRRFHFAADTLEREPPAEHGEARASAMALDLEDFHEADHPRCWRMRAAAGAGVASFDADDAHGACDPLVEFAQVHLRSFFRRCHLDRHWAVVLDVLVGEPFRFHRLLPRELLVEVYGHELWIHVESDVVCTVELPERIGNEMFAAMLLHMIHANHPVEDGFHLRAFGNGGIDLVDDIAIRFRRVRHAPCRFACAQDAGIAELAAAFREEDRLVEQDTVALFSGEASGDGGGAALLHHVRVKKTFRHIEGLPFVCASEAVVSFRNGDISGR